MSTRPKASGAYGRPPAANTALPPVPGKIDHIVNILRLRAQGAPELTASYDFEQSYDGRIVLVTPQARRPARRPGTGRGPGTVARTAASTAAYRRRKYPAGP